jgi:hypothetical protein
VAAVAYPDFVEVAVITHVPAFEYVITAVELLTVHPVVPALVTAYVITTGEGAFELASVAGVNVKGATVELEFDGLHVSV